MPDATSPDVRKLRALRISVTGRCDLNCLYCDTGAQTRVEDELTVDEIGLLAAAAWEVGVQTIRLTGGEPLVRSDLPDLVRAISSAPGAPGARDVAMTTNAQRLADAAAHLHACGLKRVNVGMPSLRPKTYKRMTGGELALALAGIEAALDAGLSPVKINVVLSRGVNADEIGDFVALARNKPVEVRFIERMPFNGQDGMLAAREVRAAIAEILGGLNEADAQASATAETFKPSGFEGRLGTIAPVTDPFCARCDRLRVTSTGKLRACLSEAIETDLVPVLKRGGGTKEIAELLARSFRSKPRVHSASFTGPMRQIGG
jgi:cyclic pyranopterin phosphate synthase